MIRSPSSRAGQLLADRPDMDYLEADVRDPGAMLAHAERFFGAERPVAVGCVGGGYFLTDDQLRSLMQQLHAFCAPGCSLAISFPEVTDGSAPEAAERTMVEAARVAGIGFYYRPAARIAELVAPWRMTEVEPVEAWLDADVARRRSRSAAARRGDGCVRDSRLSASSCGVRSVRADCSGCTDVARSATLALTATTAATVASAGTCRAPVDQNRCHCGSFT